MYSTVLKISRKRMPSSWSRFNSRRRQYLKIHILFLNLNLSFLILFNFYFSKLVLNKTAQKYRPYNIVSLLPWISLYPVISFIQSIPAFYTCFSFIHLVLIRNIPQFQNPNLAERSDEVPFQNTPAPTYQISGCVGEAEQLFAFPILITFKPFTRLFDAVEVEDASAYLRR